MQAARNDWWGRLCRGSAAVWLLLGLAATGCQQPPRSNPPGPMWPSGPEARRQDNTIDPTRIETRDDIVEIIAFWSPTPWLFDSDRVIGFKVPVYFVSGQTEKGAFVSGDIFVWIYELKREPNGRYRRELAHMWQFTERESMGLRVTKRARMGYYYGFPLRWPDELMLEGKLIEIQFGYQRHDGSVVLSSARRLKVPVPMGFDPDAQEPAAPPLKPPARQGQR